MSRLAKLAAGVALIALAACSSSAKQAGAPTTQRGARGPAVDTGRAPWPDPRDVPARVQAAGLPHGTTEMLAVHYHAHLDVFVDGRPEPVAASIGRVDNSYFSALHTHATSGLIHIEAPGDQRFTLGMLFTEWGVRLTATCAGGYCSPQTSVRAYVDGNLTRTPLPDIVLRKGEEIALVVGTPPAHIPSSWNCSAKIDPAVENPAQCADFASSSS